jgi:hypothetical protein
MLFYPVCNLWYYPIDTKSNKKSQACQSAKRATEKWLKFSSLSRSSLFFKCLDDRFSISLQWRSLLWGYKFRDVASLRIASRLKCWSHSSDYSLIKANERNAKHSLRQFKKLITHEIKVLNPCLAGRQVFFLIFSLLLSFVSGESQLRTPNRLKQQAKDDLYSK